MSLRIICCGAPPICSECRRASGSICAGASPARLRQPARRATNEAIRRALAGPILNLQANAVPKDGCRFLATMQQPILIVLHQEHSTPGRIGHALRQFGFPLDVRRPRFDEALSPTLDQHAGAVIFGGPMSANDADEFIRREIDWISVPLKEQKPFLGICLGAQMCARALGGRVFPHPQGQAEIGYYPIRPTAAGLSVVNPWPEQVYQWHREGFDLPAGAELWPKATCSACRRSASAAASRCNFIPTSPT